MSELSGALFKSLKQKTASCRKAIAIL